MATIEKRVDNLEAAHGGGGGGGCPRCRATLIVIRNTRGEFCSAEALPGGELSEAETHERETETTCPRCGRDIDQDAREAKAINIGKRVG